MDKLVFKISCIDFIMTIIIRQAVITNTQNRILVLKEDRINIYPKESDKNKFNVVFKMLINVDDIFLSRSLRMVQKNFEISSSPRRLVCVTS